MRRPAQACLTQDAAHARKCVCTDSSKARRAHVISCPHAMCVKCKPPSAACPAGVTNQACSSNVQDTFCAQLLSLSEALAYICTHNTSSTPQKHQAQEPVCRLSAVRICGRQALCRMQTNECSESHQINTARASLTRHTHRRVSCSFGRVGGWYCTCAGDACSW